MTLSSACNFNRTAVGVNRIYIMGLWALPKLEEIMQNEDMADRAPATKGDLKETTRRLSKEIVGTQASVAKLKDDLVHAMRRMQSTLLNQMDGFMTKTRKVDVDQLFLIHRMDKLEKRVDSLETRAS